MADDKFPADRFRRVSADLTPIPWSTAEVDQAIRYHFDLGRNPNVDERVADLWDAAFYLILAQRIWEGWLVDWQNWLSDRQKPHPDPEVPTRLFHDCVDAVDLLTLAGALRTRYVDDSVEEIMSRFPPCEADVEPWPEKWVDDADLFATCSSKIAELIPLTGEMARLQQHFERSPASQLDFHLVRLGTRTLASFPGTFLDVQVGYNPLDDDLAFEDAHTAGTAIRRDADTEVDGAARTAATADEPEPTSFEAPAPTGSDVSSGRSEDAEPECLVTLRQAAAMVNRSPKTLERLKNLSGFPKPRVQGGGGRPHEYSWIAMRTFLQKHFNRDLPERFPADRFRSA